MKHELVGKKMTEFAAFRPKVYSYLTHDTDENIKAKSKRHKKVS